MKQSEGSDGGRGHQDGGFRAAGLERRQAEKAVGSGWFVAAAFEGAAEAAGANLGAAADSQSCSLHRSVIYRVACLSGRQKEAESDRGITGMSVCARATLPERVLQLEPPSNFQVPSSRSQPAKCRPAAANRADAFSCF